MLKEVVKDYAEYLKLDLANGFQTLQDVIDNMITRLEELTSVLQMVKLKNNDCCATVSDDICRYRHEVTILSKKITTLSGVIVKLQINFEVLEKTVAKAEAHFGVQTDNRIKSFLMPFLKRKDLNPNNVHVASLEKNMFSSVLEHFEGNE